jgi:acyl-coenzyme A thioesterase PaaI-like protein
MVLRGPLTALLDSCCGMSVATMLREPAPFATLDLRIDYVKPATPGQAVIAEAECYRVTHSVAFTRAFAHHGDPKDPIAAAAGTFMLGTKGQANRPPVSGLGAKS